MHLTSERLILGLVFLFFLGACIQNKPDTELSLPNPLLSPTALTLPGTATDPPAEPSHVLTSAILDKVMDRFGYALGPEYLPQGFHVTKVAFSKDRTQIVYVGPQNRRVIIAYPVDFTPEPSPVMREIGLIRPDNALSQIKINGAMAHMVHGRWSDQTIRLGPGIDPSKAKWDYDANLTLFLEHQLSTEASVGVAVQAVSNPSSWIHVTELVRVAESMRLYE